jgi:hypothetical protein
LGRIRHLRDCLITDRTKNPHSHGIPSDDAGLFVLCVPKYRLDLERGDATRLEANHWAQIARAGLPRR